MGEDSKLAYVNVMRKLMLEVREGWLEQMQKALGKPGFIAASCYVYPDGSMTSERPAPEAIFWMDHSDGTQTMWVWSDANGKWMRYVQEGPACDCGSVVTQQPGHSSWCKILKGER